MEPRADSGLMGGWFSSLRRFENGKATFKRVLIRKGI